MRPSERPGVLSVFVLATVVTAYGCHRRGPDGNCTLTVLPQ